MASAATALAPRLRGSICALATPFADGAVDWAALERLILWHLEEGTHGLAVCGTTAETPALSADERGSIIALAVRLADGRIPILAGTGASSTPATIEATRMALDLGADAALVVTPSYNRPSQEGMLAHFTAVHEAVPIPLVLYTVPARTGSDIALPTLAALARLERIVGIKDATGDLTRVSLTRRLCGPGFVQLSGEDGTALGFNAHGGVGCISVSANVAPEACAAFQTACLAGRFDKALEVQDRLMPLHKALFVEASPQPTKYALAARGLCRAEMRLPLLEASEAARAAVDEALAVAGLGPVSFGDRPGLAAAP